MTTWRGTMRSIAAAARRAEREANRRRRLLEKQRQTLLKAAAQQQAAIEVQLHANDLSRIATLHQECSDDWDWPTLNTVDPPEEPSPVDSATTAARNELDAYIPTFFDRLFRREAKKRAALQQSLVQAQARDAAATADARKQHRNDYAEWEKLRSIAAGVLAGDLNAYRRAIEEANPFSEISNLGSSVQISTEASWYVEATLQVKGAAVVPRELKTLTAGGKLSVKKMPQGQAADLYQDYVASATMRVSRELFALLPIEMAFVHATDDLLDTSTGHMANMTILSVAYTRQGLTALNFDTVDCSDSLRNFVHNMDFSKTRGFAAVERVEPSSFKRPPR